MKTIEQKLIERIRSGNEALVDKLYEDYRGPFVQWLCQHFKASEHEAADIFQDALIVFYSNVTSGKVDGLSSSVKTYLFAIGKNLWLKRFKRKQRTSYMEDLPDIAYEGWDTSMVQALENAEQKAHLEKAMSKMGEKCRRLLVLSYFHRYSTEALQNEFGYRSADVVRTQKYRCLSQLRALLKPIDKSYR